MCQPFAPINFPNEGSGGYGGAWRHRTGQLEIFDSTRLVEPRGQSPRDPANPRAGRHPPLNSGQTGQKLARSCTAILPEAGLPPGQNVKNSMITGMMFTTIFQRC